MGKGSHAMIAYGRCPVCCRRTAAANVVIPPLPPAHGASGAPVPAVLHIPPVE
ncbi:hypothetical protein [Candidatus Tokpelaia sp.]|uniref:hypothetical protein n=1 Tax=Candidatus Tokpelaia sp. TaxID=2233777 RepID=UPI001680BA62|nr:hypothetical protein [Candidatus Tokpelaia sp.]